MNPFLVSTDWLLDHLDDPDVSIIDASWYLPAMNRDGRSEYDAQHIPGAVFFDIDTIADRDSGLPHTLASPGQFARQAGALGIAHTDTIVVYDGMGLFSAPRVWWNFRVMGALKVVILDGGMPAWLEDRLPVESGTAPIYPKLFVPNPDPAATIDLDGLTRNIGTEMQIADARPNDRFTGEAPEPRPGMRSGHMPGASSVPASDLHENGRLKPADELRAILADAGIDPAQPVVTTCGSGVTAATITLALETIGAPAHRLYDGSWSEWGARDDTPIETG